MRREHVYRAVLVKGGPEDISLGVVFPELPGCVSAGEGAEDAIRMAHQALALHLSGMLIDGEALPAPLPLEAPLPDWLTADGVLLEAGRVPVRVAVAVEAEPVLVA
jgi:predicted RNase H-like HicB family nuclease